MIGERFGNAADAVPGGAVSPRGPALMMQGGGRESRNAWRWMIDAAGHGDLVILTAGSRTEAEKRALGDPDDRRGLDGLACDVAPCGPNGGFNSVQMFRLPKYTHPFAAWTADERSAHAAALAALSHAEAVYFSGGDQNNYFAWPRDIAAAVATMYRERHGVVSGSSAGMAVQGSPGFDFAAANAAGMDTLETPYAAVAPGVDAKEISFTTDLLGLDVMRGVITDTHFHQRDRFGRLVAFLTRTGAPHAIACDEQNAVVVSGGVATLTRDIDKGACFFMTAKATGRNANGSVKSEVAVVRLDQNGQTFDLTGWRAKPSATKGLATPAPPYRVDVDGSRAGTAFYSPSDPYTVGAAHAPAQSK
jgi:beta-aspartyl-peptidase (threonine type)